MSLLSLPLRAGIEHLSQIPVVFDGLRWLLESGHQAHYRLLAKQFNPPPQRVLDCGCGTGIFARAFSPETYVGIDICSRYIARARARHPHHRFYQMDALNLGFAAESYDAIIVSGVLHHLSNTDARRMLQEITRVLKPDGTLLIWEDVPTRQSLNWVGRLVHSLDVGCHIRSSQGYQVLLNEYFCIAESYPLRSGFMDYSVFRCHKSSDLVPTIAVPMTSSSYSIQPLTPSLIGVAEGSLK